MPRTQAPGVVLRTVLLCVPILTTLGCATTPPADESLAPEVAAWQAFCDELARVGTTFLEQNRMPDEIDRAEAPLFLAQQVSRSIMSELEAQQAYLPLARLGATTLNKVGLDGADAKYIHAMLDSSGRYRIYGTLGNAPIVAFQLASREPQYAAYGSITEDQLTLDADRGFELLLSAERPADWRGDWFALDARATEILIREYFNDWEGEYPSDIRIERLDDVEAPAPATVANTVQTLANIGRDFERGASGWLGHGRRALTQMRNQLFMREAAGQGLQGNAYGLGYFALEPGQAIVLSLEAPDADLWSAQLGNIWGESLEYIGRTASLNGHQAKPASDGRYYMVVSVEDPGVPNWLDTVGHREGWLMMRYQRTKTTPAPKLEVVELTKLREYLPADTPTVAAEQRHADIAARRAHAAKRWAP